MLLLLGSFYLGGVCELDAAECRQNYAQETHEHVVARAGVDVSAPTAQPDEVPDALLAQWVAPTSRPAFRPFAGSPASWPWVANPPPPVRRLYLRYAVLQV
ncbi:hypothetical protein [Hymenobacter perfusus]|uniref:Uncharacterized protein n=1 Tax=Hymenobacter perfusus TaxID=1236770 RepID=A0A428JVV3_9BACT|nr:hypothetical protein [Hymenobacter perfusus]RSK38329.1 hypothetical protein EI293_21870 [Hymenobacter perfusus]